MRVRVKICCIRSVREAALAIGSGADAIGLVARMPSGPGVIPDDRIRAIVGSLPRTVNTFLLTAETDAGRIAAHQRRTGASTVQIVDRLVSGDHPALRAALPGIDFVQVVHVRDEGSVDEALRAAEGVDALLLDSGDTSRSVKELGGTGRTHDWQISRRIVEQSRVPVYLAGGLSAANVRRAVGEVGPYGVDVCSGVRTRGLLDPHKLRPFLAALAAG